MSAPHDVPARRRKSFAFFSRTSVPVVPSESDETCKLKDSSKGRARPRSTFLSASESPENPFAGTLSRQIGFVKAISRECPKSVSGTLTSSRETEDPAVNSSATSSIASNKTDILNTHIVLPSNSTVIYAGDVIIGGGLLRKKKEYMVLTARELLRYKSESRANEGMEFVAGNGRTPSIASLGDPSDHSLITMMDQVVAVYSNSCELGVGCHVQVDYLEQPSGSPSSITMQLSSSAEAQIWIDRLRTVSIDARAIFKTTPISDDTVDHIARRLEASNDYSPMHFKVYRAVQRATKTGSRSSSAEDLQKIYSTMCYLVLGKHCLHLLPIPKSPMHRNSTSTSSSASLISHGLLNLSGLWLSNCDDCFSLTFRFPCQPSQKLLLASIDARAVLQSLRQCLDYLRPEWQISPVAIEVPTNMKDEALEPLCTTPEDEFNGFERTLAAFAAAYKVDASNIVYGVHAYAENEMRFVLYPPPASRRTQYTAMELLVILRALRWNEAFNSISFRGIPLDPLQPVNDNYGSEYEPTLEHSGRAVNLKSGPRKTSILMQELRAIALYSEKLRKMDFFDSASCSSASNVDRASKGTCGIIEAVMPLCRRGLTNVDWFVFSGLELTESDLDWLVDAAASKLAHFRGFELSRCGLTERMITLFLNALTAHENTLECLDLSGNPGRFHPPSLNNTMSYFPFLRKLNLSRMLRSSGEDAILTAETLLRWQLESLDMSETKLNSASVDAIATYIASPKANSLKILALTQCGLTSHDIALIMRSMSCGTGSGNKKMHLLAGQNQIAVRHDELVECIDQNCTPTHLTLRMVDYPKEDKFRELLNSVSKNKSLQYLDISKVSLPFEASKETCSALGELFARNTTLRELDISGEQAVLESARLGHGIVESLSNLIQNKGLEILRIESQSLGSPGAMELASALSRNSSLTEIYCDMNDFHLQGFTALVDAIEHNTKLTYLPSMDRDRAEHIRSIKEKLFQTTNVANATLGKRRKERKGPKHSFRKSSSSKGDKKMGLDEATAEAIDLENNLMVLEEKWDSEAQRLRGYLARNSKTEAIG